MARQPIKLVHIINSMDYGGAEAMLCRLVLRTDPERFATTVVSLIDRLPAAVSLRDAGISVTPMGMKPGVSDPRGFLRLVRHLKHLRPDVIQTWMDHSNLIGGLANRLATRAALVWGVHHSEHVVGLTKRSTLLTVSACARLSHRIPARVVCCSRKSHALYLGLGFAPGKLLVIPNGFDTDAYRPDPDARRSLREELGLDSETPLIGLVARYDVLKDHGNFLLAARFLAARRPDVRFVLCGRHVDHDNAVLVRLVASAGVTDRVYLLGHRQDGARLQAALDMGTSSSVSEAFPLIVGEAMACGVPCVVTDVGDSRLIVGPYGKVVPPRDPDALAKAWFDLLAMDREERNLLGRGARDRISELFDLGVIVKRYEALYTELVAPRRPNKEPSRRDANPSSLHPTSIPQELTRYGTPK